MSAKPDNNPGPRQTPRPTPPNPRSDVRERLIRLGYGPVAPARPDGARWPKEAL